MLNANTETEANYPDSCKALKKRAFHITYTVKTPSKLCRNFYEQASILGSDFAQPFTSASSIYRRAETLLLRVFMQVTGSLLEELSLKI